MRTANRYRIVPLILLTMAAPLSAQDTPDPLVGTWKGSLAVAPGTSLTIVFHFSATDEGTYGGTMDSPDQGAAGIPLGEVTLTDGLVVATVPSAAGEYRGTLADGGSLEGTWSQAGRQFALNLEKTKVETETAGPISKPDADVTGTWMGRLKLAGTELRVVFRIEEAEGGALRRSSTRAVSRRK